MGMYVIPVLAVQDDQDRQGEARAERAKQLEAKLSDVRDNFFSLRDKLKETTDEAGASLEAELKVARDNLGQRYKELQSTYKEELGSLEGSLDAVWKQLDGKRDQAKKLTTAEIDKVRKGMIQNPGTCFLSENKTCGSTNMIFHEDMET